MSRDATRRNAITMTPACMGQSCIHFIREYFGSKKALRGSGPRFSWQAKGATWPWCQKVGGPFRNDDGRQRSGTDMDGQKGGHIGLSRRREWRRVASARAPRGESGSAAIEPITEGIDRDAAEFAELDMGQARPTEAGQDGGPVDLTRRSLSEFSNP